ncbi:MAG: S46 family peptidase, partial [Alistipes sp.]|nr:S46 family peptidase [Alistipes sp.]
MKRFWILSLLLAGVLLPAGLGTPVRADEGMWIPMLLNRNEADMQSKGLQLSADDIYSINHSSLKDAVVIFGGGCTGEVVSDRGLLFTNHHCGFGQIQYHSSLEHDYLTNGFWAATEADELPCPGLSVTFLVRMEDVTEALLGGLPEGLSEKERADSVRLRTQALKEATEAGTHYRARIVPFYYGNQYYMFVNEVFEDVRLVGTPPSNIGKFGGDTDNWMWPRHTGDFSIFRVYAGPDNKPADYSPENRPYRAEKYLKVSLGGVEENDFAMIMGFPGSTQRYATSYEIDNMLRVSNPQRIFIRGERQAILWEDMLASDKVRIQYASKYAGSSNYWKNSIGMSRGIEKLNVKARKQAQEAEFQAWAEANTLPQEGYIDALLKIREAFETSEESMAGLQYLSEAFLRGIELLAPAMTFARVSEIKHPEKTKSAMSDWYKDYNAPTDRKVAKRMLQIARENMKTLPSFYTEIIDNEFGGDIDAYVDYLYDNSVFVSEDDVIALIDDFSAEKVAADPAVVLGKSVLDLYAKLGAERQASAKQLAEGRRKYVAGLMLQQPDKAWAADANFTIRLTYGRVLPYDPADGIRYNHYTTLKGVMEKEDPKNPAEFTVPEKLKELYAARDFGRYANKRGELPVGFLADCDITGGNSGSPVLNARGELIGLAFDGNWEAMSGDVAFEPELQRTIAVDVRYVLFIV